MRSLWLQVAAVTAINLKSISQRRWLSLSTVVAIALVVIVLLAFLAMDGELDLFGLLLQRKLRKVGGGGGELELVLVVLFHKRRQFLVGDLLFGPVFAVRVHRPARRARMSVRVR